MRIDRIEKIFSHPALNFSEIARRMYPGKTRANIFLNLKRKQINRNRITEDDAEKLYTVINELTKELRKLIK
jgi:hypothetical protein